VKRILVISPHPDDESIGCGGVLRRHVVDGDLVDVIFLTSGEKGGHGWSEAETLLIREQEARAAAKILGLAAIEFWRQPDGELRATSPVVRRLLEAVRTSNPARLYVPHRAEAHADHRAANRIVRRALRQLDGPRPEAFEFEVWTPLRQFDVVEDISDHIEVKKSAIRAYQSQCDVLDFEASAAGLARYRGEMHSWPGGNYAEVFAAIRE
jgi:LmbE family N-acetylglucosaminyl deacetylase